MLSLTDVLIKWLLQKKNGLKFEIHSESKSQGYRYLVLRSTSRLFAFYVEKGRESNTGKIFTRYNQIECILYE